MSGVSHHCHEPSPDCTRLTFKGSMREALMKRIYGRRIIMPSALLVAAFGVISQANAQTFSSSYTSAAPKDCRTVGKPENGSATQVCPGKSGLVVVVSEGGPRPTVSLGLHRP